MATPPKYQKGMRIEKIEDAVAFILAGAIFYVPGDSMSEPGFKTVPWTFVQNWSVSQIQRSISVGLFLAERRTQ